MGLLGALSDPIQYSILQTSQEPASLSDTGYLTVKDVKRHINRRVEEEKRRGRGRKQRHQQDDE